ncbi:MAG: hypothetical protein LC631_03090 [Desulfovibrionales bacterium]|nr:hypothetical protein [Desulfovibrionales bacterium]
MKKIVIFLLIFFLLSLSAQSFAGYRIELNSGKYVVTNHFWEENGWIIFYQYGGQAGYPKNQIKEITDTDIPEPVETPGQEQEMDEGSLQETEPADQDDAEIPAELDME